MTPTKQNFIEANNHCSDEDGHLVNIYDRKEEYFIYSLISLNYENNEGKYWLDWNKEGKWINNTFNLTKESFTLSAGESCGIISYNDGNFQKTLFNCRNLASAICQKIINNYLTPSLSNCPYCPETWISYQITDMCYWISYNVTRNWFDARSYCRNFGGDLITYTSNLEESFILGILSESLQDYWIGLRYENSRYKWIKDSGEDQFWTRKNFKILNGTEGSNGSLCVFYNQKAKEWLHGDCELSKGFICKGGKIEICDKNWKLFIGNCYKIESSLAFTWHRALMYCKDNNGSLSSIHSPEELQFLSRMIKQSNADAFFWIGLHQTGKYIQWSDSSPVQYLINDLTNLQHDEERCISINSTGRWFSDQCDVKRGFICKKLVNSDTQTTPTMSVDATTSTEEENCPENWLHFENKCYKYEKDDKNKLTWKEADRKCSSLGSHLVSIRSSKQQDFLTFLLVYFERSVWIGFNSVNNSRKFSWTDNSSIEYTNWMQSDLFDVETKLCVKMLAPSSNDEFSAGKWSPVSCNSHLGYICQQEIDSTRLTTLTTLQILETCNKSGNWIKFKNRCYKMLNWSNSWFKAEHHCRKYNAHLVTINNSSFNIFVEFIMSSYNINMIWIGLNRNKRFRYKWVSGWPVSFTNWDKDQPGREGSCTMMLQSGQWITRACIEKFPFMCETASDLVPKPSSSELGPCLSKTDEWKDLEKMCYYFESKELLSWPKAKLKCHNKGGDLLSFHSVEDLNIISKYIKFTNTSYWIGLIRKHDGSFSWTDETPVDFIYWDDNEPTDNYKDNCVEMHRRRKTWNMADCELKRGYICKKNKNGMSGEKEQKHSHRNVNKKTIHPGIMVVISMAIIFTLSGILYLITICVRKLRKKESLVVTDSNDDSMTFSNEIFVEDELSEDI